MDLRDGYSSSWAVGGAERWGRAASGGGGGGRVTALTGLITCESDLLQAQGSPLCAVLAEECSCVLTTMRAQWVEGSQDRAPLCARQAPGGPSHCSPFLTLWNPFRTVPGPKSRLLPALKPWDSFSAQREGNGLCWASKYTYYFLHGPQVAGGFPPSFPLAWGHFSLFPAPNGRQDLEAPCSSPAL